MHVQFIFRLRHKSPGYYVISKDDVLLSGPFDTEAIAKIAMRRVLIIRKVCALIAALMLSIFVPQIISPTYSQTVRICLTGFAVAIFWLLFTAMEDRIDHSRD